MANKPGSNDPLAGYWPQVVHELTQQVSSTGKLSYRKVVRQLFPGYQRSTLKTYEKCIERFVNRIRTCRNESAVNDFSSNLQERNDYHKWGLTEEDLRRAAALATETSDRAADAVRIADVLRVTRATIVVGVRWPDPNSARDLIERWDFKSYATLVKNLHRHHTAIDVAPFDAGARSPEFLEDLLDHSFDDSDLVIFVGSARSNRLSNAALAKMFGHDVKKACTTLGSVNPRDYLPFHFCWNTPDEPGYYPSQMEIPVVELRDGKVTASVSKRESYGFEFQGREELVNHKALSSPDYGVVLAQRRCGQTWILALGASGPATQQCCEMIFSNELLGLSVPETDQGVLCQAIECTVKRVEFPEIPHHLADNRSASDPKIYAPAQVISPNCRQ